MNTADSLRAVHSPVRWGVLGAAAIATGRTIPALLATPSASLLALASRDPARAQATAAQFGIPRACSYEALLADPDIEAVYIPLPNALHFEWAVRALEAGKHVLCEKPLCLGAREVEQLIARRGRTGRHVEEAFGYRNHPQWTKLATLLDAGTIGPVRAVHAALAKQFLDPKDIRNQPTGGGGGVYDLGSYALSACNLVTRRAPRRVVAAFERDPVFGIDRLSSALLDYGDCHATLTVATQSGPDGWATHQQFTVLGATGWLACNFPYAQARPVACRIDVGDHTSVGGLPTTSYDFEPVNQYAAQVDRFSRRLRGDAVASWPIEDSLGILRIIEALFESGRRDAWVALPA